MLGATAKAWRRQAWRGVLACSVAVALPGVGHAAPPSNTPAPLPPAQVTLKVSPGPGGSPWRLQIENAGDEPVRIPADARLLVLDLTPAEAAGKETETKKGKPQKAPPSPRCILPGDARPSTDHELDLLIPARRAWSTTFDPLFYCFGARERAALVAGTRVKARFGWPVAPSSVPKRKLAVETPPFAVTPVGSAVGKTAPAKEIEADEFTLDEAVPTVKPASTSDGAVEAAVTLSISESLDAARGVEIATTVSLTNRSDRPVTLLYRPDMLQFDVDGPVGSVSCGAARIVTAPIRELFITVAVGKTTATSVLLTTACPTGTFDTPGVYRVIPKLDTTNASGRTINLKTWDGLVQGKSPLLLRVRSARKPELPPRPTLD